MFAVALFTLSLIQTIPAAAPQAQPRWRVPPRVEPSSRLTRSGVESASATIRCRAHPDGRVEDCSITAEAPSGSGLGQQLIVAAEDARLDPDSLPPVGDAWVSFTARFRLD